jgi:hypothetical protein
MERDATLVQMAEDGIPEDQDDGKTQGADIYFGDAAHIRSDHRGAYWGRKARPRWLRLPVPAMRWADFCDHMRFMVKPTGGVNADVFIEFLKQLLVGATRRIF